jgi:hypothetical protein
MLNGASIFDADHICAAFGEKRRTSKPRAMRKKRTPIPMRVDRRQAGIAWLEDTPTPCA